MMAAMFFSRALLSVSMMVFVAASFFHFYPRKQFDRFFSSPLLWGMTLLFFVPLLSGFWSEDQEEWMDIIRIKLPLLFLPLAFAGYPESFSFSKKQWEILGYVFILLVAAGVCWSFFQYGADAKSINENYLRAQSIRTPLENDRVRFSWLVSVTVLLAGWLMLEKRKEAKILFFLLIAVCVLLIAYLHILAVRTGLFSFYIMAIGTAFWLIIKRMKWQWSIGLIILIVALPFIAYKTIPTLQNRVQYFLYDQRFFANGGYWPHSNDAVRVISIRAGWNVMQENPAVGVGFGDVLPASKKWYEEKYPQMIETDKIYPASEWMMYGAGCGWPGFLLFSLVMLIPLLIRVEKKLPWFLLNVTAAFSFLFDIGLEVQFGVFIYSFIILWWYQWLNAKKV